MAATPEAKVKKRVTDVLKDYGKYVWYNMPVPTMYSAASLDYLCAVAFGGNRDMALSFAIETKAPGKRPTPRQEACIAAMRERGIKVFVIDGEVGICDLIFWLEDVIDGAVSGDLTRARSSAAGHGAGGAVPRG
jgi:hypothetical protein